MFGQQMQQQQPGIAGLQPQPLEPQQQIQQIQQQQQQQRQQQFQQQQMAPQQFQQPTQSPLSQQQRQEQGLDGMTPEQILQKRLQEEQQQQRQTPEQMQQQQALMERQQMQQQMGGLGGSFGNREGQMMQQGQPSIQQLQQMQQQQQFSPDPRDNMSDRDRFIEGQLRRQGNQDIPQAQIDAMRSQFGSEFDADPSMYQQQQAQAAGMPVMNSGINISQVVNQKQRAMPQVAQRALQGTTGPMQELLQRQNPAPPPRDLGVSSFGGASSNDMQRMLNRGAVASGAVGDVQNQIGGPNAPANPQPNPNTPRPPNPFLAQAQASGNQAFNSFNKAAPPAGGIMDQAPPEMAQNIPLMQNQMEPTPVSGYGLPPVPQTSAGMGFSPPPMNPMQGGYGSAGMMGMAPPGMAQMAAFPQQTMQQGGYAPMQQVRGSQNSPPIQSPFV